MRVVVGIERKAALSPGAHRHNDTAILRETMARVTELGWESLHFDESRIEAGEPLPPADLYLNMCQGREANLRLLALEEGGARIVNRPSSALDCHRVRLIERLWGSGVRFAPSRIVRRGDEVSATDAWIDTGGEAAARLWLKRGDVHAEGPDDVRSFERAEVEAALAGFFDRGIESVVVQRHLEGPLIKFYGVGDQWFRWFRPLDGQPRHRDAVIDVVALRDAAFGAARRLGLEVFGGDAIFVAPEEPVLIDVNDWPSFARFRAEAATAIARHLHAGRRPEQELAERLAAAGPDQPLGETR